MRTGTYSHGIFYLEKSSDIIFVEFPNNLNVNLAIAKELVANRLNFTENKKHYFVIDVSNVRAISTEAKEFLQHPNGGLKNILGAAFIATNPVGVLFANIFIKTQKCFDAKLFTNKEDAFEWIVEYR
ncbi:MAG: hypothetical protein ABI663_24090 [Chryseolinea sp.]